MTTLGPSVIGTHIEKKFPGHGVFKGKVISADNGFYQVQYSDGDEEELSPVELAKLLPKSMSGTRSNGKRLAEPLAEEKPKRTKTEEWVPRADGKLSEWDEDVLKRLGNFGRLPDNAIEQACKLFDIEWVRL